MYATWKNEQKCNPTQQDKQVVPSTTLLPPLEIQ